MNERPRGKLTKRKKPKKIFTRTSRHNSQKRIGSNDFNIPETFPLSEFTSLVVFYFSPYVASLELGDSGGRVEEITDPGPLGHGGGGIGFSRRELALPRQRLLQRGHVVCKNQ